MLKKLYKHEFFGLFRGLLPLYGGLLIVTVISKILITLSSNTDNVFIQTTSTTVATAYGLGIFAIFAVSVAMIITRFYKHLLSGEGYLTFSLPINTTHHIICKLICAAVLIIIGIIVTFISLVIIFAGEIDFSEIIHAVSVFFSELQRACGTANLSFYFLEFALLMLTFLITVILEVYCAISVGQRFKSRIGGAVLSYILIHIAVQMTQAFIVFLIDFSVPLTFDPLGLTNVIHFIMIGLILWFIALSCVYFFVTRHMLKNRLNLE